MEEKDKGQKLSLVFIFKKIQDEYKVLLGQKNKPGKPIDGKYNGLGGKCEENEEVEDCAVRECREESGLVIKKEKLTKTGEIVNMNMSVDVFVYISGDDEEIQPRSMEGQDMQNFKWFNQEETIKLVAEGNGIQGNNIVYDGVWSNFLLLLKGESINEFVLDKSYNEAGSIFRQSMR